MFFFCKSKKQTVEEEKLKDAEFLKKFTESNEKNLKKLLNDIQILNEKNLKLLESTTSDTIRILDEKIDLLLEYKGIHYD